MKEKWLRLVNEKAIAELLDVSVGKVNKLMEKNNMQKSTGMELK